MDTFSCLSGWEVTLQTGVKEVPGSIRDVLWEHLRRAGARAASTGFSLTKSKSFRQVFIELGEYVGGHNVSTKFYNQPDPPRHSWIMAL